jgi:hypothetical protein
MRKKIFRFEGQEGGEPNSPLMEHALDMVEFMGRAGLVTVPREPTDGMVIAGMEVSQVAEERVRAIFRAMIAAADDDGVEMAAFAN